MHGTFIVQIFFQQHRPTKARDCSILCQILLVPESTLILGCFWLTWNGPPSSVSCCHFLHHSFCVSFCSSLSFISPLKCNRTTPSCDFCVLLRCDQPVFDFHCCLVTGYLCIYGINHTCSSRKRGSLGSMHHHHPRQNMKYFAGCHAPT